MSLIEDAARRLEELRRAGAELPDDVAALPRPAKPNGETPLPEAVVAAMEAKRVESGLVTAHPTHLSRAFAAGNSLARAPARHVELNFEKLRTFGFVTPDVPSFQ